MKKLLESKWVRFGIGVPLAGIGVLIGFTGYTQKNPVVIAVGFALAALGVLLILGGIKQEQTRKIGEETKGVNSLVVYPDRIAFEHLENPSGFQQKCLNDGKYYFLKCMRNVAVDLILPDDDKNQHYYDPKEFANVVTMPSCRKYLNWSATLMQAISVAVMALIIVGELIALIAL